MERTEDEGMGDELLSDDLISSVFSSANGDPFDMLMPTVICGVDPGVLVIYNLGCDMYFHFNMTVFTLLRTERIFYSI